MMNLLIGALAPIGALLLIIYKVDRYNREPLRLLLSLFAFGGLIAVPVVIVESYLGYLNFFALTESDLANLYTAFVVAAFTEELFKWLVLWNYAYRDRAYDEDLDGIVYAVFVSLGFAAIENVGYVVGSGEMSVALLRAVTALPGHMIFGVTMGYFFSRMKFAQTRTAFIRFRRLSLLMPMLLHGVYDYILMSNFRWLAIFFVPYMIWMWVYGVGRIRSYYMASRAQFENEDDSSV